MTDLEARIYNACQIPAHLTFHALTSGVLRLIRPICYDLGLKSSWSSDPTTAYVVGPLEQQAYDDLSQSEGHSRQSRCLRHTCQSVGQTNQKNKVAFFPQWNFGGPMVCWDIYLLHKLRKKSLLCVIPLYLWVIIVYLLMSQEAALLIGT